MSTWEKPLPVISGETMPFWTACQRGILLIQHCPQCGFYQFYPRALCSNCWSLSVDWIESSGEGQIWAYTVTYQNRTAGFTKDLPYVLALVELKEGIKLFTNVIDCEPSDVKIGMSVKVTFTRANDKVSIPYFKPV